MKASNVMAPAKVTKDVPDLEEAFEEEDDGEVVAEAKEDDEETELKKVRIGGALFFLFGSVSRGATLETLSPFIFS
jgi:hypothetical protein